MHRAIESIPEGYYLYAYDDCGVNGRQEHVPSNAAYMISGGDVEFLPSDIKYMVSEDDQAARYRSVTSGDPHFDMVYDNLESDVRYVLAVTYMGEPGNKRVQSLSAESELLHGPYTLPEGKVEKFLFHVPAGAVKDGKLVLHFKCDEGANAIASIVELWATEPQ